jgi:dolichol-phosphate mannosyltransferase
MSMPLTILIPARHEEKIVTKTLDSIRRSVRTPHRVIVINDSDPADPTAGVVRRYIRNHPDVRLIQRSDHPHPTFATALTLGFRQVKTGTVLPVMADLCDDATTIDPMYKTMLTGWDIVCGSRYMPGGRKSGGPRIQSFFSKIVCLSLRIITGVPTSDISNSFKMYRVDTLSRIPVDETAGVEISMKITLTAYFSGARITEIPTTWIGRTANESKFRLAERSPRYFRIYLWAIASSLRKVFGLTK